MGFYKCLGKCCSPLPQRYVVGTAVLGSISLMFIQRISFNLAITEMAYRLNVSEEKSEVCKTKYNTSEETSDNNDRVAEFHWSTEDQALLLSVFYFGYIASHLPSGILSDKYGPKNILGLGMLISGVCTLLTPLCARLNLYSLVLLRFIIGLSQGPLFPAQSSFVARWSIPNERELMNSYMNIGSILGAVLGQLSTGYLIQTLNAWDIVFYIFGGMTFPFYLFWVVFAYDNVQSHPFMNEKERSRVGHVLETQLVQNIEVQYKKVLMSVPVWAMIIAGFGHDWAFFLIITVLPQYMSYVLLFDIEQNGALLCLPHLCMFVVQMITPYIAKFLVTKGIMSKTTQCKVFFTICNQGAAFCFLAATFAGCDRFLVVGLFSSAMGVLGMIYSCVRVVQVDLAPNMTGFLMALMNGVGAIGGFLGPNLFSFLQTSNTVEGWRNGFIFSAVIITITTVVFLIWGTSEIQDWNFPVRNQDQLDEEIAEEQRKDMPGKENNS